MVVFAGPTGFSERPIVDVTSGMAVLETVTVGNIDDDTNVPVGAEGRAATVAHDPGMFAAASGPAGTTTRFDSPSPQESRLDMNSALFV